MRSDVREKGFDVGVRRLLLGIIGNVNMKLHGTSPVSKSLEIIIPSFCWSSRLQTNQMAPVTKHFFYITFCRNFRIP
jgi:hypothetical protein